VNLKNTKWMGVILLLSLLMAGISFGDRDYDLDEFDDLELKSLDSQEEIPAKKIDKGQRLILFDDNMYLLDDDFDFGEDELDLQKLELETDDYGRLELNALNQMNPIENEVQYTSQNLILFKDSLYSLLENELEVGEDAPILDNLELNRDDISTFKHYENFLKAFSEDSSKIRSKNKIKNGDSHIKKPKKRYGLSTTFGTIMPAGANLRKGYFSTGKTSEEFFNQGYKSGYYFGINLETPYLFKFGNKKARIGIELNSSSLPPIDDDYHNYKLTNLLGNLTVLINPSLEIKAGLGLSAGSVGDLSKLMVSIPLDLIYYLPLKNNKFKVALNIRAQETLGVPDNPGSGNTSEFLNIGLYIKTPFSF